MQKIFDLNRFNFTIPFLSLILDVLLKYLNNFTCFFFSIRTFKFI